MRRAEHWAAAMPRADRETRWLKAGLRWLTPAIMANQFAVFAGFNTHFLFAILAGTVAMGCLSWKRAGTEAMSKAVLFFAFLSLAGGWRYIAGDVPFESWLVEVDKYLCPMALYFAGADRATAGDDYERGFAWACLACFAAGAWLYFAAPSWYGARLAAMRATHWYRTVANADTIVNYSRFSSFWGTSYAMSFFGMAALGAGFGLARLGRGRGTRRLGRATVAASVAACVLSQQRIAMACSVATAGVHLAWEGFAERRVRALAWGAGLAAAAVLGWAALAAGGDTERRGVVAGQLRERLAAMDFREAMGMRVGQYAAAMAEWEHPWFGHGIGTASGHARSLQRMGVNDGNYVKILYEQGLVGLAAFVGILVAGLWRGARRFREFRFETGILAFYALAAVGSNAFCINAQYAMPFWYALGRVWNGSEWQRRRALLAAERRGGPGRRGGREGEEA